jgi:DNA repair exonuclease SbcCD ATPase subunit
MSVEQKDLKPMLKVRNIGGIDDTSVDFKSGVTILAGRNATNRTSLLQGIMAALGSDNVSIKADTDEAHVELELHGERYPRTLKGQNGRISGEGDAYLEDSKLADLFAFLLESNEARRAVVTDANLRDIIMQPVDIDDIQAEIERLVDKRRETSEELDELDDLKDRLPSLEEKKTSLEERIEEKKAELEEVKAEIETADADVEEEREEQAELEEKLEELSDKRSDLEDIRYELETEQDSLESLRAEKREVANEYDELPDTPAGDLEELDARIDRLRNEKQALESDLNELQSVIGFNQEMLEADPDKALSVLADSEHSGAVTDELVDDETVTCWTCGSEIESDQIEATVEQLQERSQEMVGEINDIESELEDLKKTRRDRKDQQRQRERLVRRQKDIEADIKETEARIETLTERREAMQDEIEAIEAEVEALESDAYEEILDQHKEANQLEYDLGTLENDLERVEENIATIEDRLDEESVLESRREEINREIQDLRTRIERTEEEAIEAFNENMKTVLNLLEYDNLARIWLERTEQEVRQGRRKVTKSVFDLHIVRQTDSGTTYEDVVENLSESEREVTAIIFALAGYLAHDVYETVPFMLLDSLEAIDSDRIATLVEHLEGYSDFLVVALLPEDAQALDDDYQRITEI